MRISRRHFVYGLAASAAAAGLPGCTTNVATGRRSFTGFYSIEDDIALGRENHPKLVEAFGGEYGHPRLRGYVSRVGLELARHTEYQQYPYQMTLLNSPIVNAFALPGGFVYVTRGLLALASNEAEMAGVLAHELGHVNARHTAERLSAAQMAQLGVIAGAIGAAALGVGGSGIGNLGAQIAALSIQSYSRKQEFEADMLGVRYMSKAGYDPDAMATFLGTLREQSMLEARSLGLPPGTVDQYNMMSTHPRTIDRVREATAAAEVQRPERPREGRQEYLAHINGMLFGDDPEQGIAIGRRFVHPVMRFEFTVPEGFRLRNAEQQVVAQNSEGAAVVFDIAPLGSAWSMEAYLRSGWAKGVSLDDVERFEVNGLEAASGRTRVRSRGALLDLRLVAIRRDESSAYRLMYVSPRETTARLAAEFDATTSSFRTLTREEAAAIRPLHLVVVDAKPGDSVERLAAPLPYGALNADWFRVLNDLEAGEQPRPDQPLKLVRA